GNETTFEVFKELPSPRRRNAHTVLPGIGRTRSGQRPLKCVFWIGARSAQALRPSGFTAARPARAHDRTRPLPQLRHRVRATRPSRHDPERTFVALFSVVGRLDTMACPERRGTMRRREFITLIGGAAAWPLMVCAQQPDRMRRIGVLMSFAEDDPQAKFRLAAFTEGLQQLDWTVGRNVKIDVRWGAADAVRSRRYAAELVALAPDVV